MTEVVLYHHVQGLTDGVRSFAGQLREAGTPSTLRTCSTGARSRRSRKAWRSARSRLRSAGRARRGRRRRNPQRRRLRRPLLRSHACSAARADPARRPRCPAPVRLPAGYRVRGGVARRRPRPGARQGGRPVVRRGRRGGKGACRVYDRRRALSLPRRRASLRGLVATGLRPRRRGAAHGARARVPERRGGP